MPFQRSCGAVFPYRAHGHHLTRRPALNAMSAEGPSGAGTRARNRNEANWNTRFAFGQRKPCTSAELRTFPWLAFKPDLYSHMTIRTKSPKRTRPSTVQDPMMGFRAPPLLRASIVKWAENQADRPTLPEAVRRLVELGLTAKTERRSGNEGQKQRARTMAGETIDEMADATANQHTRASRKRRLLKGPEEFQDVRVDRRGRKT